MRTLVLGGSGAIGSAVARQASSLGHETHVGIRASSDTARLHPAPQVHRHVFDVTDPGSVIRVIEAARPEWIVMAAFPAQTRVATMAARRGLLEGMVQGLLGVFEAVETVGYRGSVTLVGTAMCYGDADMWRTDAALRPHTLRGAVKSAESILAARMARSLGITLTEVRVFTGYGPFEQRGRLVSRLLRAGLTGERVRLTRTPAWRDWIHYDDVAAACLASARADEAGPRVFNACSGGVHNTHEVARILEDVVGRPLVGEGEYDRPDLYGDARPGQIPGPDDGVKWTPRIDLREGLERTWEWARSTTGRSYLLASPEAP